MIFSTRNGDIDQERDKLCHLDANGGNKKENIFQSSEVTSIDTLLSIFPSISESDLTSRRRGEMRFVQFRQVDDAEERIRVGVQKDNGNVVDLTNVLPNCNHLLNALTKLGTSCVIEAAAKAVR